MNQAPRWMFVVLLMLFTALLFAAKAWHQRGELDIGAVLASLPLWLFWLLAVPVIWWLTGRFKLSGSYAALSFVVQILISLAFLFLFAALVVMLKVFSGGAAPSGDYTGLLVSSLQSQFVFALFVYWSNTLLAYLIRHFLQRGKGESIAERYENAILVKTSFGYVLVEIESFKYVKGGGRKILFETNRSTPYNRQRMEITSGRLVQESRYRTDRNIVIDLAKIRRAVIRGKDDYVFFIGYSHELHLNQEMYKKLGGWLPRPVLEKDRG